MSINMFRLLLLIESIHSFFHSAAILAQVAGWPLGSASWMPLLATSHPRRSKPSRSLVILAQVAPKALPYMALLVAGRKEDYLV